MLLSCSNEIEQTNPSLDPSGRVPISLSVYTQGGTRGEPNTTSIDNMKNGFEIAIMTEKDGELQTIVEPTSVVYNSSNDSFEFWGGETYLWPEDENQPVYVYAYGTHSYIEESGEEISSPAIINPWNPDWVGEYQFQEGDLTSHLFGIYQRPFSHDMVCFSDTITRKENGSTININFRHATSKLSFNFRVEEAGYTYQLKSFKVHNYSYGVVDLMTQMPCPDIYQGLAAEEMLDDGSGTWISSTNYEPLSGVADYVLAFPDKVKLEFEYDVIYMEGSSKSMTVSTELDIQSGISYTYNITLPSSSNEIGVVVNSVQDWTEENFEYPEPVTIPDNAIDLGLPSGTLWATENLPGMYYWANVESGGSPAYVNSYVEDMQHTLTKYCTDEYYGLDNFTDGKTTLEISDDAAYVQWGDNWRLPTNAQIQELVNKCSWAYITEEDYYQSSLYQPGYYVFKDVSGFGNDVIKYFEDSDWDGDGLLDKNESFPYNIDSDTYIYLPFEDGNQSAFYMSNEVISLDCIRMYGLRFDEYGNVNGGETGPYRQTTALYRPVWNK